MVFPLTALVVVAADQLSKAWVRTNLAFGQSLFEVGFFQITRVHNTGAAFGLFPAHSFALTIVALVSVAAILFYALFIHRRFPFLDNTLGRVVLGLVLGGATGNLIDRLRFGYVIDFIDFRVWPAFNIADSAIVVGAILFAYFLCFLTRSRKG